MKSLVLLSALLAVSAAQYLGYPYAGYYGGYYGGYYPGYTGYPYAAYSVAPAKAEVKTVEVKDAAPVAYPYYNYATPYAYAAPVAVPAPAVRTSQHHAQDEFGQFNYGYADPLSAKNEIRRADGVTTGSYQYVDANGEIQTTTYISDPINGFRVKATNLPVAPVADLKAPVFNLKAPVFDLEAPVFDGVAPEPVEDTAEVKAAKAEFKKLYDEAAAAAAAAPDDEEPAAEESRRKRSALLPALGLPLAAPLAKTTYKTASLESVEADTPADTDLLEVQEKEHEAYVPAPITYAHAAPLTYVHSPVVTKIEAKPIEIKPVEVKTIAAPAPVFTYGLHAPVITKVETVEAKPIELKSIPVRAYHVPHSVYSIASEVKTIEPKEVKVEDLPVLGTYGFHGYGYTGLPLFPLATPVVEKAEE